MRDTWTSKRDMFNKCYWWKQITDESFVKSSQLIYSEEPAGWFYAKESNAYSFSNQVLETNFMFESKTVTLVTTDDVKDLKRNDLVEFDGIKWRVDSIQVEKKKKQRHLLNNIYSVVYYISLRG